MKSFKDKEGREWLVDITVDSIKRVRNLRDVDLMEVVSGEGGGLLISRLATDPILLVDVLYAAVMPQCTERKVSDEDFGRAMAGDVIEQATNALLEGIADFFPLRRRQILMAALGKINQADLMATAAAGAKVEAMDVAALLAEAEAERDASRLQAPTPGASSTSSPASPPSSPAP